MWVFFLIFFLLFESSYSWMVVVVVVVGGWVVGWVGGLLHLVLGPNVTFLAQLPFPKHLDTQKKTWRHHKKVLPPSSVMIIIPFNTLTYIPSQWDWVECHRVIYQQFRLIGFGIPWCFCWRVLDHQGWTWLFQSELWIHLQSWWHCHCCPSVAGKP